MNHYQEDSLKKRYLIKLFSNLINAAVNIIFIALVPKALGPVSYGHFSYLQQFFAQVTGLFDAGTSMALFTKLSADQNRKELITLYSLYMGSVFLFLSLALYLLLDTPVISMLFPQIPLHYVYIGMGLALLTWLTQILIKISDAYALTVSVELLKTLHKLLSLGLLLYFLYYLIFDLSAYFNFQYITSIAFIAMAALLFIKKDIFSSDLWKRPLYVSKNIREIAHYSRPIFLFAVVSVGIGMFDIWLLQQTGGSEQTGFYALAYSIAAVCFLFTGAMTPIITREFSKYLAKKEMPTVRNLFKRYIPMLYSISAFFGVFIVFQSENLIDVFTDTTFHQAAAVLMVIGFYPIHQTYGQLSGSLFFATGHTGLYKNIGLITSLFGIVFTILFLYFLHLGAIGLAYKMVIAQIIGVTIQLYYNCRFLEISMAPFLKHQFYSLAFFILLGFISAKLTGNIESPLVSFIVSGSFYTLLTIIGGFVFPQIFALTKSEIKTVLSNTKKGLFH